MSRKTNTYNAYESELVGALLIGATTVQVQSTVGLTAPLYLVVDPDDALKREWIRIDTINVNTLENITRGLEGSAGAPSVGVDHDAGAKIRAVFAKQHLDDLFADSDENEANHTAHVDDPNDPHAAAGYLKLSVADTRYLLKSGDSMTGTFDMNGQRLIGLVVPVDPSDAVTKDYVDNLPAGFDGLHASLTDLPLPDAHHTRYADAEAVSAMGTVGNVNPLNHARYADSEAIAAVGPHTVKYTDGEAVAAVETADTYYTKAEIDAMLVSYYTLNSDPRAIAGRRLFIQSGAPAMSNGDVWHQTP